MAPYILPPGISRLAWRRQLRLFVTDTLRALDEARAEFGPRFSVTTPKGNRYVLFSSPPGVKAVFDVSAAAIRHKEPQRWMFGEKSIFALNGAAHRQHQKWLLASLKRERVLAWAPRLAELVREDLASWPVGTPFAAHDRTRSIVRQSIYRVFLGITDRPRVEDILQRRAELTHMVTGLNPRAALNDLLMVVKPLQIEGRFSPWSYFLEKRRTLFGLLQQEVQSARAHPQGRDDLVTRLIAAAHSMGEVAEDDDVVHEMSTVAAAADDTTSTVAAWALYYLLLHPPALEAAVAEVDQVLGQAPMGAEHADRLPYVSAAISEAIRLSGVFPVIWRRLLEDQQVGDLHLPAGTNVLASAYLAHREPDTFPQPDQYLPQRHLDRRYTPYEFFPYGGGYRRCIGSALGQFHTLVIIATVLQHAQLRLEGRDQGSKCFGLGTGVVPALGARVVLERLRLPVA